VRDADSEHTRARKLVHAHARRLGHSVPPGPVERVDTEDVNSPQ
jgi:hypothetical protein